MADITKAEWQELLDNYRTLGPTAREVLCRLAKRLAHGRRHYNDDFDQPRDWHKEAGEEGLDMCVYLTVETIKRERSAG